MILKDKALDELIEKCEKKSEAAYRNYQDSGHGSYWNTHRKYEDMADTLKVARDSKKTFEECRAALMSIGEWAHAISKMPYYTPERRERETARILAEIADCALKLRR